MTLRSTLPALPALAAALLFGASTPLAKALVGDMPPLLLAGLLYLGSGLGLGLLLGLRRVLVAAATRTRPPGQDTARLHIPRAEWPWLLGAILFGGVCGPALLMLGLTQTGGATASLLLNVEAVLTALIAWLVFRENADRRVVLGMAAIVLGGVLLAWEPGGATLSTGALLVVGACLCWAVDNNLTRKVSTNDAMLVAGLKGLLAGATNTALALAGGAVLPAAGPLAASLVLGFFGYGLSLTLFVLALRTLGTARSGAYFSVAPLFGVAVSFALWPAAPGALFWAAAALMAGGVWLHVRERHEHAHVHEPLAHSHRHRHDAHHRHTHAFAWNGEEPHTHAHVHEVLVHRHAHFPDIHHRHRHGAQGGHSH
ncbi:EamA family transporter [Rhodoferax koreense]|uniref:EamA family transporter n=1 Tax=Rhodoferax koreensis TaxID=1842727 RepID=A0A1P8JV19_9BURK|nr:DMT family transporter [Rhodoferax koreense]APW37541.1 EamA family transporter [Rhodoferax koreense]